MILAAWLWLVRWGQLLGLAMLLLSLPFKNFYISFASFWIVGAVLADRFTRYFMNEKVQWIVPECRRNRYLWLLTSIYGFLIVGLLWTSNFKYATWDLVMKLPFLFMPITMANMRPLSTHQIQRLLIIFLGALVAAVSICLSIYWGIWNRPYRDIREISIYISHIRFSLLIALGIVVITTTLWKEKKWRLPGLAVIAYFLYFLWVIESVTGFAVTAAVVAGALLYRAFRAKSWTLRIAFLAILLAFGSGVAWYALDCYSEYFTAEKVDKRALPETTVAGNKYFHDTTNTQLENGHYVWLFVQEDELRREWNRNGSLPFDSTDALGQPVSGTLIRYLSSLGLTKDSVGVSHLSAADKDRIGHGIANAEQEHRSGLRGRIDKILFEYDVYRNGGNPSGHSVLQRLEFWKTAKEIISRHPFFGVGTGDVNDAFAAEYNVNHSKLSKEKQLRAHNQYLTIWVTYGIFGLLWFLYVLLYPVLFGGKWKNGLYMGFFLIAALSFLTEDTLETQVGVTFFVFFNAFLLLLPKGEDLEPARVQ